MKIACVNDSHFGARNDSSLFLEHFISFYENVFFPYLKDNDIKNVIHLGDFFDRRKYVNFSTLKMVREKVLTPMEEMGVNINLLLGNHDTYYKNTNKVNSPKELLSGYSNIHINEKPVVVEYDGLCVGLVPWINEENKDDSLSFLSSCKCPIVAGHFEFNGYEVLRGVKFSGGMSDSCVKRFEKVLSGHFHSKSHNNNVFYLGTQYQITFSDLNDAKGFHVLDTETRELEFVENPERMFYSFVYDDTDKESLKTLKSQLTKKLENKFVKIVVENKTKSSMFETFIDALYELNVADLSVIEDFSTNLQDDEKVDLAQDTLTIINTELDLIETDLDKESLKRIMKNLYMESITNEE